MEDLDARRLPGNPGVPGFKSVVLVKEVEFDSDRQTLTAEVDKLTVVAIGYGSRALVLLAPTEVLSFPEKRIKLIGEARRKSAR